MTKNKELNYGFYKYTFQNLKVIWKYVFVFTMLFSFFAVIFIMKLPDDTKIKAFIGIMVIVIFTLIMFFVGDSYKTNNFDPPIKTIENDDIDNESTTDDKGINVDDSLSESELLKSLSSNESLPNKYKASISIYIKSIPNQTEQIFYGNLLDKESSPSVLYNPIVYIAENSTNLIVEMRNNSISNQLYKIQTDEEGYDINYDDNNNISNKVLDACLNDCSEDDRCQGIFHGGINNSNVCESNISENFETIKGRKYFKVSGVDMDDTNDGTKIDYTNACYVKDLPLSKWIHITLHYDHNNYYLKVSYGKRNFNKVKKICHFENQIYNKDDYKKISFKSIPNSMFIEKKNFKISKNVY